MFKNDSNKADFLNSIKNNSRKRTVNKFGLGNHRLRIETGKHTIPKSPENTRICSFCHLNEVKHRSTFHCFTANTDIQGPRNM